MLGSRVLNLFKIKLFPQKRLGKVLNVLFDHRHLILEADWQAEPPPGDQAALRPIV